MQIISSTLSHTYGDKQRKLSIKGKSVIYNSCIKNIKFSQINVVTMTINKRLANKI